MRKSGGDFMEIKFGNEVFFLKKTYNESFGLELSLFDSYNQKCANLSVFYPKLKIKTNEILLKIYSENESIANFLIEKKILQPSSKYILVGRKFCPVCKVQDLISIESYCCKIKVNSIFLYLKAIPWLEINKYQNKCFN